jgi:hypothetical protein
MSDTLILSEGLGVRVTQTPEFKAAMRQAWRELKPPFTTRELLRRAWEIYRRRGGVSEMEGGLDFVVRRRRYPVMEEGLDIRVSQTPEFKAAMRQAWRELTPPFSTAELMRKAWEIYRRRRGIGLEELEQSPVTHPQVWSRLMKETWKKFKSEVGTPTKTRRKRGVSELALLEELGRRGLITRKRSKRSSLLSDLGLEAVIPKLDITNLLSLSAGVVATIYIPKVLEPIPQVPAFLKTDIGKIVTRLGVGVVGNLVISKLLKRPDLGKQFFIGSIVVTGLGVIDKYVLGGKIGLAEGSSPVALSYYVPPEEQVVKGELGYYVSPEEQVVTEEF